MGSFLQSGLNCVQLVGDMTINARDAAIKKFTDDPDCKIFLVSLKAGGIALNLTVASHVSLFSIRRVISCLLFLLCGYQILLIISCRFL